MPDLQREALQSMAEELADMMGAHHPGRPAYYALMHAARAVKEAAQDVGEQERQGAAKGALAAHCRCGRRRWQGHVPDRRGSGVLKCAGPLQSPPFRS